MGQTDTRLIRESAQYALVDGEWYQSAHEFDDSYPTDVDIYLWAPSGGENEFPTPATSIERMESVEAEALYNGTWFWLGSIWTTETNESSLEDLHKGRVRVSVPFGADGYWAELGYDGPDWKSVSALPLARFAGYGETRVLARVPLAALDDYRERSTPVLPQA